MTASHSVTRVALCFVLALSGAEAQQQEIDKVALADAMRKSVVAFRNIRVEAR
jgi:hypothetical protein